MTRADGGEEEKRGLIDKGQDNSFGSQSWFVKFFAVLLTFFIGLGKIVQGMGSGIFGAMQGGGAFSPPVNSALGDMAAGAGGVVTAATRVPKLFGWAKDAFGRCKCFLKGADNPDPESLSSQDDPRAVAVGGESRKELAKSRSPGFFKSYFLPENVLQYSFWRKLVYTLSKPLFAFSGFSSLLSTTLIAFQSGALLLNRVFNLIGQPLPLWAEILWSVFVAVCTGFMYFTFNVLRILPRSHELAATLAELGLSLKPRTARDKIIIAITAILALSFSGGMFGFSIVSTRSAIQKFMSIFFPTVTPAPDIYNKIAIAAATPSILSTLLTGCADLYEIFTRNMVLRKILGDTPCKSIFRVLGFGFLFLAGAADAFCGNWLGFWGGLTGLLNELGLAETASSWVAAVIAFLALLPYWANNGGQIFFINKTGAVRNSRQPSSLNGTSVSNEQEPRVQMAASSQYGSSLDSRRQDGDSNTFATPACSPQLSSSSPFSSSRSRADGTSTPDENQQSRALNSPRA